MADSSNWVAADDFFDGMDKDEKFVDAADFFGTLEAPQEDAAMPPSPFEVGRPSFGGRGGRSSFLDKVSAQGSGRRMSMGGRRMSMGGKRRR